MPDVWMLVYCKSVCPLKQSIIIWHYTVQQIEHFCKCMYFVWSEKKPTKIDGTFMH